MSILGPILDWIDSLSSKRTFEVTMPESVYARLEHIRALTHSHSVTSVVRKALTLYDTLVPFAQDPAFTIIISHKDGLERELRLDDEAFFVIIVKNAN